MRVSDIAATKTVGSHTTLAIFYEKYRSALVDMPSMQRSLREQQGLDSGHRFPSPHVIPPDPPLPA